MPSPTTPLEPLLPPVERRRPRTLAALGLTAGLIGVLAVIGGFVPALGTRSVVVGGVLLAVGLVLSLIALISRRQGGTGLGVAGVIVALLGGVVFVAALVVSMWVGLTAEQTPTPKPTTQATSGADEQAEHDAAVAAGEKAFLSEARPQIRTIVKQIKPGATDQQIDSSYSDDILLLIGYSVLDAYNSGGAPAVDQQVDALMSMRPGVFTKPQAARLVDVVLTAARAHLVE
ncbi:hypothetical protein [Microbacterium sp.]|uniref:hypothetical protein n=1 Tax=Microbacterium sp. TaxID=51671 RepID=UPI003A95C3B0